jgi:hypothetical protein
MGHEAGFANTSLKSSVRIRDGERGSLKHFGVSLIGVLPA